MNERGEAVLFTVALLLVLSGLMVLSTLQLKKEYQLLVKRKNLVLCIKEFKGELNQHLKFMGKTNWAIQNTEKVKLVSLFIPGLQGLSMKAEKAKRYIMQLQDLRLLHYQRVLLQLQTKKCQLDPQAFLTPFALSGLGHLRQSDGAARLRSKEWTHYFIERPYVLSIKVNPSRLVALRPKILYLAKETEVKFPFLSSLP